MHGSVPFDNAAAIRGGRFSDNVYLIKRNPTYKGFFVTVGEVLVAMQTMQICHFFKCVSYQRNILLPENLVDFGHVEFCCIFI